MQERPENTIDAADAAQDAQEEPEAAATAQVDEPTALRAERDELKERMLRLAAETENYKKRSEREKAEFLKRANEALVRDLLPVLDNLERALASARDGSDAQGVAQGVDMVHQELKKVLERHGLEAIESLGQPFDPERHEAMMQQEDPELDDNTVLNQLQRGYMFQDRLLRPAMVIVSKRPAGGGDDDSAGVREKGTRINVEVG